MDHRFRGRASRCKHILFVLLRVLGDASDDPTTRCAAPRRIPPAALAALLAAPAHRAAHAAPAVAARYEALCRGEAVPELPARPIDDDTNMCAICYEELVALPAGGAPTAVLAHCRLGCGRSLHAECLARWGAARRRAHEELTCPFCRAPWEPPPARKLPRGEYVNVLEQGGGGGGAKRARRTARGDTA